MYLLDTMVLSESFKKVPHERVISWIKSLAPEVLLVSVLTFGEIAAGLEKKRRSGDLAYSRLEAWASETRKTYVKQTLQVTSDIAVRWGTLSTRLGRRDMDVLIAATVLEHDLIIATRNTRHFAPTGAKLFNSYEA